MIAKLKNQVSSAIKWWSGDLKHLRRGVICTSEWYGHRSSGFYINPDFLHQRSIVYSLGIGDDVSFDKEVIAKHGCFVFAFDPTPKSIRWVAQNMHDPHFVFQPVGIGTNTGPVPFFVSATPQHEHGNAPVGNHASESLKIEVMLKSLKDLADLNGHKKIDVLKLNIDGAEFEIIPAILSSGVRIDQMLIKFHDAYFKDGLERTKNSIAMLQEHGYEVFAVSESDQEVSLIRKSLVEVS
jgi:FkbM family methyltransferase